MKIDRSPDPIEAPTYAPTPSGWRVRLEADGKVSFSYVDVPPGGARPFLLKGLPAPKKQFVDPRAKRRPVS